MNIKDCFIERIEPFVVATALSGVNIELWKHWDTLACITVSEKIDNVTTRHTGIYIHFREDCSVGVQYETHSHIEWFESTEKAVDNVMELVTEYLNR